MAACRRVCVEIGPPGLGQGNGAVVPHKKPGAEIILQEADLLADRGLRNRQFLGGERKAHPSGNGIEGADAIELALVGHRLRIGIAYAR